MLPLKLKASIIVPTNDRPRKLMKTLISLEKQDFSKNKFEVIIINDGNNHNIESEIKNFSYQTKYYNSNNKGPAVARNIGIENADSEIILFTDDDCKPPKNWVKTLVKKNLENKNAGGVGGYLEAPKDILGKNIFARLERFKNIYEHKIKQREIKGKIDCPMGWTGNISYKKSILERVGGFDESFDVPGCEDLDLKIKVCKLGYDLIYVPLKMEHNKKYNIQNFIKRSINLGKGYQSLRKKHKEMGDIYVPLQRLFLPIVNLYNCFSKVPQKKIKGKYLNPILMFFERELSSIGDLYSFLNE